MNEALPSLFALLSPALGADFIGSLVDHLTKACGVDYALVGRSLDASTQRFTSVCVSNRGSRVPNFEYELGGKPCAEVFGKTVRHFAKGVAAEFPTDVLLGALGIESYLGVPLFARSGAPLGVLAVLHRAELPDAQRLEATLRLIADRTAAEIERDLAAQALQASEARLAAVVDGSPGVAIQWYDRTGRVMHWNRGSEAMFGFTATEAMGRRLVELIHTPEEMTQFLGAIKEVEQSGRSLGPNEYRFRRRDGRIGHCLSTVFAIPGDGGAPWFVCMDIDITHEKEVEAEQRRLEDQMRHAQKLESLGVLAGGVAHDFNNLLTSVLGHANLLGDQLPPGSLQSQLLSEIESAARRAADLTRQMLSYAGKANVVVEPFCLGAAVREMAQLLAVPAKRVELRTVLESVVVNGDATQLRQVAMNLITNACEAVEGRPGIVEVRTGRRAFGAEMLHSREMQVTLPSGEYAFLEVRDDGVGMDAATMARIFDPFFTTKRQGRGLGLAAVQGIVRSHGGLIRVESKSGAGTLMTVVLPASSQSLRAAKPSQSVPNLGGGRILVIDDEKDVRRVAVRLLAAVGFECDEAAFGDEGIARVAAAPGTYRAVLIDLTMPGMDGFGVAQRLCEVAPTLPRILMSGYADPRPPSADAAWAHAFVQKPFVAADLVAALQAATIAARG